jgi:hypothetical protein
MVSCGAGVVRECGDGDVFCETEHSDVMSVVSQWELRNELKDGG